MIDEDILYKKTQLDIVKIILKHIPDYCERVRSHETCINIFEYFPSQGNKQVLFCLVAVQNVNGYRRGLNDGHPYGIAFGIEDLWPDDDVGTFSQRSRDQLHLGYLYDTLNDINKYIHESGIHLLVKNLSHKYRVCLDGKDCMGPLTVGLDFTNHELAELIGFVAQSEEQ